ncbi:MAG TPA: hypothetical protein DCP02_00765 [Actinobacteria bacterium]|nr:hypothetical protein [Actinomycetota bacterium]
MTRIDRKVLKSVSELSSFKFLLVFYLIFFIISVVIMAIIALLAWLGLSSSGINLADILQNFGISDFGLLNLGGGTILYVVVSIIGGLVASVFYAAFGTLMVWIINVILKISGGIELRFIEREDVIKK